MDSQQIFQLIDSILPFEVCLYYQVLPLSIQGSRLHLGMVDPKDVSALDYVRRILGYVNCSVVPKSLESQVHSDTLSAYLKYSHSRHAAVSIAAAEKTSQSQDPKEQKSEPPVNQNNESALVYNPAGNLVRTEQQIAAARRLNKPPEIKVPPGVSPSMNELPVLTVHSVHLGKDLESLAHLPPNQLLQELLARVLQGGIGRLYFERQLQKGRILWSQNGVVQSVLSNMSEPLFQSTLNEFKRLVNLSLIPVKEPKQVEILRSYQNADLLLRLRIMPGVNGEEATLQVLRGAALKFYQQQQIVALSRDALRLAHQLEYKINQLERNARNNPDIMPRELDSLPVLNQLIQKVENQIKFLRYLQEK
jgi:type II secretory ATPase GspE/PulE/Tfp pilus assembly ATPase PilB-like protein